MPFGTAILSIDVGTGLANDARILAQALAALGHPVEIRDMRKWPVRYSPPDCAIFFERFSPKWAGRFNVLIPNHEWIRPDDLPLISRFDLVACKTLDAMSCMRGVADDRLLFLGFTSLDRYRANAAQVPDQILHIAGCSRQKGTRSVIEAWEQNPDLPSLTVLDWRANKPTYPILPNLRVIDQRISDDELVTLMNQCGVHLCPSLIEGFGHTMHEAMSCGAVLITTDGPPMNELTRHCAVLVSPSAHGTQGLATTHEVDPSHLAVAVRKVAAMSLDQHRELGQAARGAWEQNLSNFHRNVENMARIIGQRLSPATDVVDAPATRFGSNPYRS